MNVKLPFCLLFFCFSYSSVAQLSPDQQLPEIDYEHQFTVDDNTFLIKKERSIKTGVTVTRAFDDAGNELDYALIPKPKRSLVAPELKKAVAETLIHDGSEKYFVVVALSVPVVPTKEHNYSSIREEDGLLVEAHLNEKRITRNVYGVLKTQAESVRASIAERRAYRNKKLQKVKDDLFQRHKWLPPLIENINPNERNAGSFALALTSNQILELAEQSTDLIEGIEMYGNRGDTINDAMTSTGIDPWALGFTGRDGDGIGIYMTETGCPAGGHISNYTRLGTSTITNHSENVSAIIRAVSPSSWLYCRGGGSLPHPSDLDGVNGNPPIHAANISWGQRDFSTYRVLDRDWDNLIYNDGVSVFSAAGNEGDPGESDEIVSPGKAFNAVTVGAYNDANEWIAGFTSLKNPAIGHTKPDVLAPGTSIVAGGHTSSGTSQAAPHAAGFSANLMTAWMQFHPAAMKAKIMASSINPIDGYNENTVGAAGLDFQEAYYSGVSHKWSGSNSAFNYYASNDGGGSQQHHILQKEVNLTASMSNVRFAFVWLNRGTWAYQYPSSSLALGTDYAVWIRSPSGQILATNTGAQANAYRILEIDPSVTGTYTVEIERISNDDNAADFIAGLNISW